MESKPMIRHGQPTAGAATLRLRSRWSVVLAALPLAIALGSGQAAAQQVGNRDFMLNNLTRFDIDKVSTSTADSDVWTVIRNSGVRSGSAVSFRFDNVGECVLQLRVDFTDGNYAAWTGGIDFCNIDTITITFNGGNNTFRATAQ
jgi:hypothetical protein